MQTGYISETQKENAANQYTAEKLPCDNKLTQPEKVQTPQLIAESPIKKEIIETRQKAAEMFNTNRTYISEAQKIKNTAPEVF